MKLLRSDDQRTESGVSEILVIEDDVLQAHEIEMYFERQGFTVSKLTGGSDSLHNVARIDPKVVIVDYHLPDIDGTTVAARVHRLVPQAAVILMSGRIDFVHSEALDRLGVVAFFKKPINLGALRRLVSKLVKNPSLTRKQLGSPLSRLFSLGG
jgi:DNA-binding NtrC family response regulator